MYIQCESEDGRIQCDHTANISEQKAASDSFHFMTDHMELKAPKNMIQLVKPCYSHANPYFLIALFLIFLS